MPALTPDEAKAFYDRFGSRQDNQAFYEAPALDQLVANSAFEKAQAVLEFGCGTGRVALDLLARHLPPSCAYRGTDISTTMVGLAGARLAPFGARASVTLASGVAALPSDDRSVDRVVSTYVLDLLPAPAVHRFLAEARRVLRPQGLLCLVGITHGTTLLSRVVMRVWQWLYARNPSWVGGCRPTDLTELLSPSEWKVRFRTVTIAWGIASEVVVAAQAGDSPVGGMQAGEFTSTGRERNA